MNVWAPDTRALIAAAVALTILGCGDDAGSVDTRRRVLLSGRLPQVAAGAHREAKDPSDATTVLVLRRLGDFDIAPLAADGTFAVNAVCAASGMVFLDADENVVGTLFLGSGLDILPLGNVDETVDGIDLGDVTIATGTATPTIDPTGPGAELELTATERAVMKQHGAIFSACVSNLDIDGDGLIDTMHGMRYGFWFSIPFDCGDITDQVLAKRATMDSYRLGGTYASRLEVAFTPYNDRDLNPDPTVLIPGTGTPQQMWAHRPFSESMDYFPYYASAPGVDAPPPGTYIFFCEGKTLTIEDIPLLDPEHYIIADEAYVDFTGSDVTGVHWQWRMRDESQIDPTKLITKVWIQSAHGYTEGPRFPSLPVAEVNDFTLPTPIPGQDTLLCIGCADIFGNELLSWFTVKVPTGTQFTLRTQTSPAMAGTISPAGDTLVNEGCMISVMQSPSAGFQFSGWSGKANGSAPCHDVTVANDCAVTAHFVPINGWEEVDASASGLGILDTHTCEPRIAIAPGPVVALSAWTEAPQSELCVSMWDGASWSSLPLVTTALGRVSETSTTANTALSLDDAGTPFVLYTVGGTDQNQTWHPYCVYLEKWNGTTWAEIGGSATGDGVWNHAVATPTSLHLELGASGNPVTAVFGGSPSIKRWSGSAWQDLTGVPTAAYNGAMTVDSSGNPVIAYGAQSGIDFVVHYLAWNGAAWTELGGSATGPGVSVMMGHGMQFAVAMDPSDNPVIMWEDSPPGGGVPTVLVARWDGSSWETLPGTGHLGGAPYIMYGKGEGLAVDPVTAQPVIMWSDMVCGQHHTQVYVMRWSGTSWEELGPGSASGGGISVAPSFAESVADCVAFDSVGAAYVAYSDWMPHTYINRTYVKRYVEPASPPQDDVPSAWIYQPERSSTPLSGTVTARFVVTDIMSDNVTIDIEYSTTGGATWNDATIVDATLGTIATGDITGVSTASAPLGCTQLDPTAFYDPYPGRSYLAWDSAADGVGATGPAGVRLRITATDDDGASPATDTFDFVVDQTQTGQPTVAPYVYGTGMVIGTEMLGVELIDVWDTPVDALLEFSIDDGATWASATVTAVTDGWTGPDIGTFDGDWVRDLPSNTTAVFTWDTFASGVALTAPDTGVHVRITAENTAGQVQATSEYPTTIDNSGHVTSVIVDTVTGRDVDITVGIATGAATLNVRCLYSIDGGTTWLSCDGPTVEPAVGLVGAGIISDIPYTEAYPTGQLFTLTWHAGDESSVGATYTGNVIFRVEPWNLPQRGSQTGSIALPQ